MCPGRRRLCRRKGSRPPTAEEPDHQDRVKATAPRSPARVHLAPGAAAKGRPPPSRSPLPSWPPCTRSRSGRGRDPSPRNAGRARWRAARGRPHACSRQAYSTTVSAIRADRAHTRSTQAQSARPEQTVRTPCMWQVYPWLGLPRRSQRDPSRPPRRAHIHQVYSGAAVSASRVDRAHTGPTQAQSLVYATRLRAD